MKKYPFTEKIVDEIVKEMDNALENSYEMTEEEIIEDDAAHGYFEEY